MRPARLVPAPSDDDLARARGVIAAYLRPTPLVPLTLPDGREIGCKLETFQPTGSFKVRGALAAVAAYATPGTRLVTASAGNHGLGMAYAAARLGATAKIVVPRTASPAKREALRRLGADVVEHGDRYEEAERQALTLAGADAHARYVSPYNDPHVIAGQATCAAEIAQQVPEERTLIVPVGGGGLIAGTTLAGRDDPQAHVIGVEAEASRALSTAVRLGRIADVDVGPTLADGLAGNLEPGAVTPRLVVDRVRAFVAVTEGEIEEAIRFLARAGWVVEGSGAVGVAALLAGKVQLMGRAVALITGRNMAMSSLARILQNG